MASRPISDSRRAPRCRFRGRRGQEKPRADGDLLLRVVFVGKRVPRLSLAAIDSEYRRLPRSRLFDLPAPHARKERREFVKLPLLPGVGLVVVALGALDLDSHEDPRNLAGHLDGLGLICQGKRDGAVFVVTPCRRHHSRDNLIPGRVGLQSLRQPVLEGIEAYLIRIFAGRVKHDHIALTARPSCVRIRASQVTCRQVDRVCLWSDLAGTTELAEESEAGRSRRNKSGGRTRHRLSTSPVRPWDCSWSKTGSPAGRAQPTSGSAARPIGTGVWAAVFWPVRRWAGSR